LHGLEAPAHRGPGGNSPHNFSQLSQKTQTIKKYERDTNQSCYFCVLLALEEKLDLQSKLAICVGGPVL